MHEPERRTAVRQRYHARCGYCSVHETEAGSALEVDHFQPRAAGGGDDLDNLIYCCPACNRLKGDFWPLSNPDTTTQRLLHPGRNDLTRHLREEPDGRLAALTATGAFQSRTPALESATSRGPAPSPPRVGTGTPESRGRARRAGTAPKSYRRTGARYSRCSHPTRASTRALSLFVCRHGFC